MRRRPDDDDEPDSLPESGAEGFLDRSLQKHRRLVLGVGIGLGVLVIVALIAATFSDPSRGGP